MANTNTRTAQSRTGHRARSSAGMRNETAVFQDYALIMSVLFLVGIGLVLLYSTSSYEAALKYGDSAYYLKRQLVFSVLGTGLMFFISIFPVALFRRLELFIYGFSTLLLLLIIPFGRAANGAKRWLYVGPISIQPAEISKIAIIIITSSLICRIGIKDLGKIKSFAIVIGPAVLQAVLILVITRNLSSAAIVGMIAFGIYFIAVRDYKIVSVIILAVLAAGGGLIYASVSGILGGFRSDRILAWLHPENYAEGTAFQTLQALYAIGSGGFFGKGLGQSVQKLGFIPEAQNDMIFSIVCEELGLFGAIGVMLLFLILIWRFVVVANRAEDLFSGLVVSGVITHVAVQVILNIAVVTNTMPNTGVTLPFISYGGSSIILMLAEIGMVLSVARRGRYEEAVRRK